MNAMSFVLIVFLALSLILAGCGARETPEAESPPIQQTSTELTPSGRLVNDTREIQVRAFRYGFSPDPIVVNRGERVRLIARSDDVPHGFAVAEYNLDFTISSDSDTIQEFTADRPGSYHIHCSVYCGPGHQDMHGELVVLD